MHAETLNIILQTPLFLNVDAKTAEGVCKKYGREVSVEAGERLVSAGEEARRLGIILSGAARVYKTALLPSTAGGKRIFMNLLKAGEMMGAAGLFQKGARAVTEVVATQKCDVLFFDESELKAIFSEHFAITENYLAYLTGRIHFLTARIETMGSTSARNKLLSHISANAKDDVFTLKAGYNSLADALGIGRASLYRAMDALENEGAIKREGNTIVLLEVK